jgi:TolB-like protein/Tfp pilus assembly protein PilF
VIEIPGYRIEAQLGQGGMATVYLALQLSLQRQVALKVLAPALARDPGFTERFLREGRIAASLRHRHILAIHDVAVHAGQAYLALEYLPGGHLADLPMAPRTALRLVREIASALALAHAKGIVHRDIKPANILLQDDGSFVLADFGIARMLGVDRLTQDGGFAGTPAYMAPEQWRNQAADARSDIYALGVVLHQALTGCVPYDGDDGWAIGLQHQQAPLPRLPEHCAALQELLAGMLAKDPATRIASAEQLILAVQALEQSRNFERAPDAPAVDPVQHLRQRPQQLAALFASAKPVGRARWRSGAGILAGLALLLGGAWGWSALRGHAQWEQILGTGTLATVAVLPCESYGGSSEHQLMANVLAEELIHRLSRLRALTVIARSSSFPLRQSGLTAIEIGARLRASHLLACSIRPAPGGVRIVAELVETSGGTQRWSAEYDRSDQQLMAVVDELAVAISERLLLNLAGPERARLIQHRTDSMDAIRLVEQARSQTDQMTLGGVEAGRKLIEQALAIDPGYARAYVALADIDRAQMQLQQRDFDWWQRQAEPLLQRALEIDPELPGALVLRSQLRCARRDWAGCRADIDQALSFGPGAAEVRAAAAEFHMSLGSRERAVEHAQRWLQIEPESPRAWNTLTRALLYAGRGEEALTSSERSLQRFAGHWPSLQVHALVLEQLGRCSAGIAAHERALALTDATLELDSSAASLYVCGGRLEHAQALLRDFERRRASADPISDLPFAMAYLALDQKAQALTALEALLSAGDPRLWQWVGNRVHGIDKLAGEPRFLALIARLQLPPEAMNWQPDA